MPTTRKKREWGGGTVLPQEQGDRGPISKYSEVRDPSYPHSLFRTEGREIEFHNSWGE